MKGIYIRKDSPYYWFRYYDTLDSRKKRKEHNTKIPVTPSDKQKMLERVDKSPLKLSGTPELWKLVKEMKKALNVRKFESKSNTKISEKVYFKDGYARFRQERTVPGSKHEIKNKTLENYNTAVDHVLKCVGNKLISSYSASDYEKLLIYFEEKGLSRNSRSIYTRALKSLWQFFFKKGWCAINIIEPVTAEQKDPDPIPLNEMMRIITYFKSDTVYPHHYHIIYFMLLTGCRPSSAMVQLKENIDFKKKQILIQNIKTGNKKGKPFYIFPIYKELEILLNEMGIVEGDTGRLFPQYSICPQNYTYPLTFWKRSMANLIKNKSIAKKYKLKQIRPTFASYCINVLELDIFTVQKLLDHTDIKVTDKSYVSFKLKNVRELLNDMTKESFYFSEL